MNVLAWPLTALALVFMYPWARWLLNAPARTLGFVIHSRVLVALTTLALSIGTLSLVMLWLGLLGMRIDWRLTVIFCVVISAVGWIIWLRAKPAYEFSAIGLWGWWRWPILIIAVICLLILFNATYWPFGIDDAVTIYATFGKQIATTGQLPHGDLYETYPMLVPLAYAFTHQAAGWVDEHLAALIPAILSVGVIGVAYLLGRFYGWYTGIIAALLIALTPMFTHWASAGYVDLPAGFFYGLSVYFLLRWDQTSGWADALLVGIMAGLCGWTKNSGLLIVISIAIWVAYYLRYLKRDFPKFHVSIMQLGLMMAGFLVTAGPWYIRNLSIAGVLVPPTGWIDQASRTLSNLFPYIVESRYFPIGWLFTIGLIFTIWRFTVNLMVPTWEKPQIWLSESRKSYPYLLIFYIPFFTVWWALFSYDGRFLLVLTPFAAVMGAQLIDLLLVTFSRHTATNKPMLVRYFRFAALLLILVLAIPAASAAVDHKTEMLRNPLMSDAEKHHIRLGADRYDMAIYLRTLPPGARVWTQDLLLPYNADGVQMTIGGWPTAADLAGYDYWLLSPGESPPEWLRAEPIHIQGGYRLYAVSR